MRRTVETTNVTIVTMENGEFIEKNITFAETDKKKVEKLIFKKYGNVLVKSMSTEKALYTIDDDTFFKYATKTKLDTETEEAEEAEETEETE